ncbi:MAG: ADP-ribosylglycohydrolase family protein [Saprospiraceae bacterium]|nr:ADP-ribosylglycohydrolase family protein [Saprospiraceae bacterium]
MLLEHVAGSILGLAVGDALGVPVEFESRHSLKQNPVTDMRAYGSHRQPVGTWSDDSSLALCLAESLTQSYDLKDVANRFVNWYNYNYWTPHGEVFDVGIATSQAIHQLGLGIEPTKAGGKSVSSNGNGSLMRILPLLFYIYNKPIEQRFAIVKDVSSLTHAHIRSVMACFYYLEFARLLMQRTDKFMAFEQTKNTVNDFLKTQNHIPMEEIDLFHRLLVNPIGNYDIKPIYEYKEAEIYSSGYVLHTLEASIWCILTSDSYAETVLKAVNLGEDTDTTGAVAGGLAGIMYTEVGIPKSWLVQLVKVEEIRDLTVRLFEKMSQN